MFCDDYTSSVSFDLTFSLFSFFVYCVLYMSFITVYNSYILFI